MIAYTRNSTYEIIENEDGSATICRRGEGHISVEEMVDWAISPDGLIADISDVAVGKNIIFTTAKGKKIITSRVIKIVQG